MANLNEALDFKILMDIITKDLSIDNLRNALSAKSKYSSSIAKGSSDLILTFPILFSNKLSLKTAEIVSQALEVRYATMLQLLLSSKQLTSQDNLDDFLKDFHNDISNTNFQLTKYTEDSKLFELSSTKLIKEANEYAVREANGIKEKPFNTITAIKEVKERDFTNLVKNINQFKKYNAANPFMLNITLQIKNPNGNAYSIDAVYGVKAKIYQIDSSEILNRIVVKKESKFNLFNFIRAISGEISFWKDFVLSLDKIKLDANNASKKVGSKFWKVLERRARMSKLNRSLGLTNYATAISTLVISADEVDYIKTNYDIDLRDAAVAREIMDDYNFISIIIIDESLETVKSITDTGKDEWDDCTLDSFKKDEEMDYKKVVKLLNKMA